MDGLNGQRYRINHCIGTILRKGQDIFSQPGPHLHRLPRFRQSNQSGNDGLHGRCLVGWYLVRCVAVCPGVTVRVLINGRQGEFLPVAGLRELNLYFCVVHH